MSVPNEFDFAVIKIGNGATPTEVFAISCGKQDITTNFVANSTDRFVRDCTKPGEVPKRKPKVTGTQLDITAAGLTDKTAFGTEVALIGTYRNVRVEYYDDNGTDTGVLMGTVACRMLISALNISAPRDGDASAEIVLASDGAWTYTAAP